MAKERGEIAPEEMKKKLAAIERLPSLVRTVIEQKEAVYRMASVFR